MELSVQRIDEREFDGLASEWNALLARSAADNFFLRWEWMHTWWQLFKKDRTLCILTVRCEGRLVGLLPLYGQIAAAFPKARELRFCSDELSPDYLDVVIEKGYEPQVIHAFAPLLTRQDWDLLVLEDLLKDSVLLQHRELFASRAVHFDASPNCPYIKITDSFEGYIQKQRETKQLSLRELNKKERKLFEDQAVSQVAILEEERLPRAFADLFLLHKRRASQKGFETNFTSDIVLEFHCKLSALLLKEKMVDLNFLYHAGQPISATYAFKYKNKVYRYQQGMDPRWSQLSVGMVLHKRVTEQAFAEGLEELDLLKGDEAYKNEWANNYREEVILTVYNRTLRGQFLHARRILKEAAKKGLRTIGYRR